MLEQGIPANQNRRALAKTREMKTSTYIKTAFFKARFHVLLFLLILPFTTFSQQLKITDFIIFGGSGQCSGSTVCGVELGPTLNITGGAVGSYRLVKSTGGITLNGSIFSEGIVQLTNGNTIKGRITAKNISGLSGTTLSVGSNANITGNIDVNGNIVISGGTVSGKVTHPTGTTYSGPAPAGGNITGPPSLPGMPTLPEVTSFDPAGTTDITSIRPLLLVVIAILFLAVTRLLRFQVLVFTYSTPLKTPGMLTLSFLILRIVLIRIF